MTHRPTRVLMVYPRFAPDSFWVYTPACEIVGARYPTAPLGMITVAAMLPSDWEIRLVNRNTEDLAEGDLEWADMVMTGGMLFQQADCCASRRWPTRSANRSRSAGRTHVSPHPTSIRRRLPDTRRRKSHQGFVAA